MKKLLLLLAVLFLATDLSYSQADTTKFRKKTQRDTTGYKKGWTPLGTIGMGISQVALSNWTRGGENLISITGNSDFNVIYFSNPWLLKNNLSATIGSTKTGSGNFQTNDNAMLLENVLIYKVSNVINPYVSNEVRSGVLNGYDYSIDPIIQTSAFFDPGYITQSIGAIYDKPNFSSRLGLAFQETFANQFRQYTDDINTTDVSEAFKFQTGVESVTSTNFRVADNLFFNTRLRLFSAFNQLDVWDVGWDNTLAAVINNFMTVTLDALVVYEKSQSPKTQFKEGLQLGINYTVF
ncbi:MAG: DUF3078 domain-containing protein [Ignavibacteria bacterium]|nr:DUF3078 domain-containing protein [Ignavibacteria bacterium]